MAAFEGEIRKQQFLNAGIVYPVRVLTAKEVAAGRNHCDELEEVLGGKPRTIEVRQMLINLQNSGV